MIPKQNVLLANFRSEREAIQNKLQKFCKMTREL